MKTKLLILCILCILSGLSLLAIDLKATIALDKTDGFYKCGETAICTITVKKDGQPLVGKPIRVTIKQEGKVIATKDTMADGNPLVISHALNTPGWLYFGVEVLAQDGKPFRGKGVQITTGKPTVVAEIGALFDADRIIPAIERPEDFDAFWKTKREELNNLPLEPKLMEIPSGAHNVKLYTVEIPCTGRRPATGYLAVPELAAKENCPAIVEFRGWVYADAHKKLCVEKARRGVLSFYATWHGFPVNQPEDFYQKTIPDAIQEGELDICDRNKWVMGDVYLRVMRILDFIKSRPEWDRKTLVTIGRSLGGAQSAVAAALDKDITFAIITVPAFAEFDTRKSGRMGSIPHRTSQLVKNGDARPYEAAAYYDLINFASLIKCEVYVATGFADETCPPSSVFAFYNTLTCPKHMNANPFTGHGSGTQNTQGNARLEALYRSLQ